MSPEIGSNGGYKHQDIGSVGVGRASDAEKPFNEQILQSRLERISWELHNNGPSELIGTLIESCKDLTKEGDGTTFMERAHIRVSSQTETDVIE